MKALVSALTFVLLQSLPVMACSELGAQDFEISKALQSTCAKMATKYALNFASSMAKIEKSQKNYMGPKGEFKAEKLEPTLYLAQNRSGNSKLIGFNVGLKSKNKWQCNFCVKMAINESQDCRIESIEKHMCSE